MKILLKTLILSVLLFCFSSCSKDDDPAIDTTILTTPIDANAFKKGTFTNGTHTTRGNVTVNSDKTKLNFTDFKTDNGPDLRIYLVENLMNVNASFVELGRIKGVEGNYEYDIPANTDLVKFKYVVVWCKDFSVNFGQAELG